MHSMRICAMTMGQELAEGNMRALLVGEGLEVISVTDLYQAGSFLAERQIALVLLGRSLQSPEGLADCLSRSVSSPVVMAMSDQQTDWEGLQSAEIDGYIPEAAGKAETVARIRAVLRRHLAAYPTWFLPR